MISVRYASDVIRRLGQRWRESFWSPFVVPFQCLECPSLDMVTRQVSSTPDVVCGTQHHTSLDAKLHVACHSHHFGGGILISRPYRRRPCGYLKDLWTPSVVSCDSGHGVRNAIY